MITQGNDEQKKRTFIVEKKRGVMPRGTKDEEEMEFHFEEHGRTDKNLSLSLRT